MRHLKKAFNTVFVTLLAFFFTAVPCKAEDASRIAVLPFEINAQNDLQFLREGILDMLNSRLAWQGKVEMVDKESVKQVVEKSDGLSGESLALVAGSRLKADYVLFGSITIVGESASIDAQMAEVSGQSPPLSFYKQAEGLGRVIPEINRIATDINRRVFNRQPAQRAFSEERRPRYEQAGEREVQPGSNLIVTGRQGQPGRRSPGGDYITYARQKGSDRSYFKSRKFGHVINGIAVGDVNRDGEMETVIISEHYVYIYKAGDTRLVELAKTAKNSVSYYVGVDVADINGNGVSEIFVSSLAPKRNRVNSFVLEFNGSEYAEIVADSPYYYRVVHAASAGENRAMLLGQKQERNVHPFSAPVYRMAWKNNTYAPGPRLTEPGDANALGVAYGKILDSGQKHIALFTKRDRIQILNTDSSVVWDGEERYGGSLNSFVTPPEDPTNEDDVQYLPLRLLTADTNRDGLMEIITASNYDVVRNILKRFRRFKKGHVKSLSWNGLTLEPFWKTNELPGRVSDFFIGDFNNDGTDELILAYVSKEGFISFTEGESFVVGYDLFEKN